MVDLEKVMGGAEVGMVVADKHMTVIYVNEKAKKFFKAGLKQENLVGRNLTELHSLESVAKIKELYADFKNREQSVYHYTIETSGGIITIVIIPFYDGGQFSGSIEYIFKSSLG